MPYAGRYPRPKQNVRAPGNICGSRKWGGQWEQDRIEAKTLFHAYWVGDFGRKQELSIKSLIATQHSYSYEIWVWVDDDLDGIQVEKKLKLLINKLNNRHGILKVKHYSVATQIGQSVFKRQKFLFDDRKNIASRSDGFRMWALHEYGGVYFDLDMLFLRNMGSLIAGDEFAYAWERQKYANTAILYLKKDSYNNVYLTQKIKKCYSTQPWKLFEYSDRKLDKLVLYPHTLFDPLWNDDNVAYWFHKGDDLFSEITDKNAPFEQAFPYSYAYHWHNRWRMEIKEDSFFALFEKQINSILEDKK